VAWIEVTDSQVVLASACCRFGGIVASIDILRSLLPFATCSWIQPEVSYRRLSSFKICARLQECDARLEEFGILLSWCLCPSHDRLRRIQGAFLTKCTNKGLEEDLIACCEENCPAGTKLLDQRVVVVALAMELSGTARRSSQEE